jgi:hypothetical protein
MMRESNDSTLNDLSAEGLRYCAKLRTYGVCADFLAIVRPVA